MLNEYSCTMADYAAQQPHWGRAHCSWWDGRQAAMASDAKMAKGEIEALRQALTALRLQLEPKEEFRALRQLDEREREGRPLESLDGVLFRGRLVRRLEDSSKVWRAYVMIEAAIDQLEGSDVREPGLIAITAPEPFAPIGPPAKAPPSASPTADASTLSVPSDIQDKRVRVKVRAASQSMSPPPASTDDHAQPAHANSARQLPPKPAEREASGQRSVLDRIRLVSTIGTGAATSGARHESLNGPIGHDGGGDIWEKRPSDGLPPAIDPVARSPVPLEQPEPPGPVATWQATPSSRWQSKPDAQSPQITPSTPKPLPPDAAMPAPPHSPTQPNSERERLDAVEAELARLIDDDVDIRHYGAAGPDRGRDAAGVRSLEPDVFDSTELEFEEAEVTIVRLDDDAAIRKSEAPEFTPPIEVVAASSRRLTVAPASRLNQKQQKQPHDKQLEIDDDAGHYADVEEAAVEIVIPARATTAPHGAELPTDNRPGRGRQRTD